MNKRNGHFELGNNQPPLNIAEMLVSYNQPIKLGVPTTWDMLR
jgi:hypothetical protein